MTNNDDDDFRKLNDYIHARARTEMFLGSREPHTQPIMVYEDGVPVVKEITWVPAVFTAFREILDNSLDEVAAKGFGDRIDIAYDEEAGTVTIKDNGRGIPITKDATHNQYIATMAMSETKAGRNFGVRGSERGQNGLGAAIVNFCSEYFTVEINRDKKNFIQNFSENADGSNPDLIIEEPMVFPVKRQTVTGTKVAFKLSRHVFHDLRLPDILVRSRVHDVSMCYPKVKFSYNGEPITTKSVDKNLFPDHKAVEVTVSSETIQTRFWLVPNFFTDISEYSHSLVNGIPVFDGGSHMDAFKRAFFKGLLTSLESMSKRKKLNPNNSDIVDGLLIFNITEMKGPIFDSQSKTRLKNENIGKLIQKEMDDPDFFRKVIRTYPDWIESIYERCRERTQKKDDADLKKLARGNKRVKVEDLMDASGQDRSKCILFLAEGKSAISGLTSSRDPMIHGGLPLRGKVDNIHGESLKDIAASETLKQIMMSIGLFPGQKADRRKLRYGKVYLTCDADVDGLNITALLTNFFYRMWPELFQDENDPFIYNFETPLIIATRGKQRKYWYADNANAFVANDHKGWDVVRAKGLAALKKPDWDYALANPKLIPMLDDGQLEDVLNLLFDKKRADDRKEWMKI